MIISFFGHSKFYESFEYIESVMNFFEAVIGDREVIFYLGGYGDFDEFAYVCCKRYKEAHPNAVLVFVTPYMTLEYQNNHLKHQARKYDEIIYPDIENIPLKFAIWHRNKWMIDRSDYVVFGITHKFGGAYKAYEYACRKRKNIFMVTNFID